MCVISIHTTYYIKYIRYLYQDTYSVFVCIIINNLVIYSGKNTIWVESELTTTSFWGLLWSLWGDPEETLRSRLNTISFLTLQRTKVIARNFFFFATRFSVAIRMLRVHADSMNYWVNGDESFSWRYWYWWWEDK